MAQDTGKLPAAAAAKLAELTVELIRAVEQPPRLVQGWQEPLAWAKATYKARRVRDQLFNPGLFAEPCWDLMLDLYVAHLEGKRVTVSSACTASGVPTTTALRHLDILIGRGLLTRTKCQQDGRRVFVDLTPRGVTSMHAVFEKLRGLTDAGSSSHLASC